MQALQEFVANFTLLTRAQEARRLLAERREVVEELERAKRDYLEGREALTSSRSGNSMGWAAGRGIGRRSDRQPSREALA